MGSSAFLRGSRAIWHFSTRKCQKHEGLGSTRARSALFYRSDCGPGRGGCPGALQGAPGVAAGRPEAAGGLYFDPDGKTRGFGGPGAPKHRKFAYKSGGPEGCSGGPNVRVTVGKPTFRFWRFGRRVGLGGRIRWICTCFTVYSEPRSGPPKSTPSGPGDC